MTYICTYIATCLHAYIPSYIITRRIAIICDYTLILYVTISIGPISTVSVQGTTDSVIIGRPYSLECIVNMREEVNTNIVKIDWIGHLGSITNDSRITIHPIVSNDKIIFNSTLQFLHLSPNDNGTFTCNVTILKFNISQSQTYQLDNITGIIVISRLIHTYGPQL